MKANVTKINTKGEPENIGTLEGEDLKAVLKGYKPDEILTNMYSKDGIKQFYIVDIIKE